MARGDNEVTREMKEMTNALVQTIRESIQTVNENINTLLRVVRVDNLRNSLHRIQYRIEVIGQIRGLCSTAGMVFRF